MGRKSVILIMALVVAFDALILALPLAAQRNPCTDEQAAQAEKQVDSLKTWDQVYRSFKKFAQCDDGAIAEGYSDAVGKLLANDWGHFPRLAKLARVDKDFERFVVRHVDESLTSHALKKISQNARSKCPANANRLCALLAAAASGK
jgi:hypothetical protein